MFSVTVHKDGSIFHSDGRCLYMSCERFVREIGTGRCCFVCGASPDDTGFNDEHILPNWLLREYDLHSKTITLPNGQQFSYGRYTVPCCEKCNHEMGRRFEDPIRDAAALGYEGFAKFIENGGGYIVYQWLSLIFLKTHIKDNAFRMELDRRKDSENIAAIYDWADMHHMHTIARTFHSHSEWDGAVTGSFACMPALIAEDIEPFDFCDFSNCQTLLLRFGEIALFAVFNDSGASAGHIDPILRMINGALSPPQLRELMAEFAFVNAHLQNRPDYKTVLLPTGQTKIVAEMDGTPKFAELDMSLRGSLMARLLSNAPPPPPYDRQEWERNLAAGNWSFLRDEDNNFVNARKT